MVYGTHVVHHLVHLFNLYYNYVLTPATCTATIISDVSITSESMATATSSVGMTTTTSSVDMTTTISMTTYTTPFIIISSNTGTII